MARKVQTKAELVTTTAVATVTPLHTPAYEAAEAAADRISKVAFSDNTEADKKKGTAIQRMAAAIFYHHSALVASGEQIAALALYNPPRPGDKSDGARNAKAAMRDISMKMRTKFVGKVPARPLDNVETPAYADALKEHERKARLLGLGLSFAGLLARHNIPLANFVEKAGVWFIHPQMLCPVGFAPMPGNERVLLDGSGFIAAGRKPGAKSQGFYKAQASVSAFQTASRPPVVRDATKKTATMVNIIEHCTALRNEFNRMAKDMKRRPNKNDFHDVDLSALQSLRKMIMQIEAEPIVIDAEPVSKTA